jgi:hypothetical protein
MCHKRRKKRTKRALSGNEDLALQLRRSKRPATKRGFIQRSLAGRIFRLLRSSPKTFEAIYDAVRKSSSLKSKSAVQAHRAVSNALNNLQARGLVLCRSRRYAIVRSDAETAFDILLGHAEFKKTARVHILEGTKGCRVVYERRGRPNIVAALSRERLRELKAALARQMEFYEDQGEQGWFGLASIRGRSFAVDAIRTTEGLDLTLHLGRVSESEFEVHLADVKRILREARSRFRGPRERRAQFVTTLRAYIISIADLTNFDLDRFATRNDYSLALRRKE